MAERRALVVAASVGVAVLAVLAAMGGAWLLIDDGDSSGVDAEASDPEEPELELEAVVEEISAFVEEQRGLEFREPVDVELADDAEFEERLIGDFEEEDVQDIEDTEGIFRALGLIDPDVDLVEQVRGLVAAGVVGFYDPETNELVVRGTELSPYTRQTLAHELTHALDDQHFELFRPELDEADDESSFGFSAIVEGNATVVENAFEETLTPEEQDQRDAEESSIGAGTDFSQFPDILAVLIGAPYELGEPLVETILDAESQARLDQAFDEPPSTTEQVLHPERFLAGEEAQPVPEPNAGGEVFDDGMFGELFIDLMLSGGSTISRDIAAVGDGWGGDDYVAWREGEQTCIRTAFVMDTPEDLDELGDALTEWAVDQDHARVRVSPERVVLTSCD